jgi:hypothetical protein
MAHQLKRDNHFVPQFYLKNWGDNKKCVWTYNLIVPNANYPKWKRLPIKGIAFQRYLLADHTLYQFS